jgi:hypothetical protein
MHYDPLVFIAHEMVYLSASMLHRVFSRSQQEHTMAIKMSEAHTTIPRTAPPDYATATAIRPQDEARVLEIATAWIPNLRTTQTARYTRLEVSIPGLQIFSSRLIIIEETGRHPKNRHKRSTGNPTPVHARIQSRPETTRHQ